MRVTTKPLVLVLVSAGFLIAAPSRSEAGLITYTETVVGIGVLNSNSFQNALVTLTLVGDTTTVTNPSAGIYRDFGTLTVMVNGATDTLVGPADVFVNQTNGTAGFETFAQILGVQNSSLTSYALTSSIGPLTGTASGNVGVSFFTTSGNLFRLDGRATTATFQAVVPATVPEPASVLLMGLGVAGTALIGLRSASRSSRPAA